MRILLDESLPRRLGRTFAGHEVSTVVEAGWSGVENGELLRLAATRFEIFVTADQSLQFQQNLGALPIAVAIQSRADQHVGFIEGSGRRAACSTRVDLAMHSGAVRRLTPRSTGLAEMRCSFSVSAGGGGPVNASAGP